MKLQNIIMSVAGAAVVAVAVLMMFTLSGFRDDMRMERSSVRNLQTSISGLSTTIGGLNATVKDLQRAFESSAAMQQLMSTQGRSLYGEISRMGGDVSAIRAQVAGQQRTLDDVKSSLDRLTPVVYRMEGVVRRAPWAPK